MKASSESGLWALTISRGFCSSIRGGSESLSISWRRTRALEFGVQLYLVMTRRALIALTPALLLPSCSSGPTVPAVPEKPAEPITGLHALYQMYTSARAWAQDLQILRYSSINIPEVPRQPGKAAAWQV